MITSRAFAVRAIRQNLLVHFALQFAETKSSPLSSAGKFGQHHAQPQEPGNVGEIVIAGGNVRELKMLPNEACRAAQKF